MIEAPCFLFLLRKPLVHVLRHTVTRRAVVELLLVVVEFIRPRARRAELGVQASAAPRGLDDEHRFLQCSIHREAEGELRPDLAVRFRRIVTRTKARRKFPCSLSIRAAVVLAGVIRNPGVIAHRWRAICPAHLFQQWCCGRVIANIIKRLDLRVALHVGLSGEDEDLQRLGRRSECRCKQRCNQ